MLCSSWIFLLPNLIAHAEEIPSAWNGEFASSFAQASPAGFAAFSPVLQMCKWQPAYWSNFGIYIQIYTVYPPSLPMCSRDCLTSKCTARSATAELELNSLKAPSSAKHFLQTGNHCMTLGTCLPAKDEHSFGFSRWKSHLLSCAVCFKMDHTTNQTKYTVES